jgi:hypothetical protein
MPKTLAISKALTSMAEVEARFAIGYTHHPDFFSEWQTDLPTLSPTEQSQLASIQQRFIEHRHRRSLPEGTIDKLMVSPLLDLAGLYNPEFTIRTEATVEIALTATDEILQGRIDTLILRDQFWVIVVEAKHSTFALSVAIPQALTYMLSTPHPDRPVFGLVTNGEEFRFIKLTIAPTSGNPAEFDLSDILSIFPPSRSQLPQVVQILKRLKQLI